VGGEIVAKPDGTAIEGEECKECKGGSVADKTGGACGKKCGPDVTSFLNSEVSRYRDWGHDTGSKAAQVAVDYLTGAIDTETAQDRIMKIIDNVSGVGWEMKFYNISYQSTAGGCPSVECGRTVTVCSKCIDLETDFMGNFLYGYAFRAVLNGMNIDNDVAGILAAWGLSEYLEITKEGRLDGTDDMGAIELGYSAYAKDVCGAMDSIWNWPFVKLCQWNIGGSCNDAPCSSGPDSVPSISIPHVTY
jgi:hypothetical protein